MSATIVIYCCGVFSLGFAVFHAFFWKIFDWKNDLRTNSIANRAIIQIANLCLIYLFLLIAFVCFAFPNELITSKLGNAFLLGVSLFWLLRTAWQFVFLPYNHRMVHLLTVLFVMGTILFALPVFLR